MDAGGTKLLKHMVLIIATITLIMASRSVAESESSANRLERDNRLPAVDPVGNYLLKRLQRLDDDFHRPEMTSDDKRMADPVGSYLLRRSDVDPVGSYLLKKSTD